MRKLTIGILAHVDAGKTTLSECMLYNSNTIRSMGRVDDRDSFLDYDSIERDRGITVFSKEARFNYDDVSFTLIDTPGHSSFYKELERSLAALDVAVLVISASEGVTPYTKTIFARCVKLSIPVFVFVNKMDMGVRSEDELIAHIKAELGDGFVSAESDIYEECAMESEELMTRFLEGKLDDGDIRDLVMNLNVSLVYFGSALKNEGVNKLMDGIVKYADSSSLFEGIYVIKITRVNGERLTHVKVFSGNVSVRDELLSEKITQIRQYNGSGMTTVGSLSEGDVGCLLGLTNTSAGMCIGGENPLLGFEDKPVINVKVSSDVDEYILLEKLKEYEQEEPSLNVATDAAGRIYIDICGKMYQDVLKEVFKTRYGITLDFDKPSVLYKETIKGSASGVGHFEPLRHYAHVEVKISAGELGSGIRINSSLSEDVLDKNYQSNIINALTNYKHRGILIGGELTDVIITLVYGKAHKKHTSGADFYEASRRAVRCALNFAENVILEPYYVFTMELPTENLSRALYDLNNMKAEVDVENSSECVILKGLAPVVELSDYQEELMIYTRGQGRLFLAGTVYRECHNTKEVIKARDYMPAFDIRNPSDSVICEGGSSKTLGYMETIARYGLYEKEHKDEVASLIKSTFIDSIGTDEIDEILSRSGGCNRAKLKKNSYKRVIRDTQGYSTKTFVRKEKYLLVDGYNVIHAFAELSDILKVSFDGARGALMDILCNYQGATGYKVMLIFDAYKVLGGTEKVMDYHNIKVVYTKQSQTADQYIERFAGENASKYDITVVTSDGLEQIIVRGFGCKLISSREFEGEIERARQSIEKYSHIE